MLSPEPTTTWPWRHFVGPLPAETDCEELEFFSQHSLSCRPFKLPLILLRYQTRFFLEDCDQIQHSIKAIVAQETKVVTTEPRRSAWDSIDMPLFPGGQSSALETQATQTAELSSNRGETQDERSARLQVKTRRRRYLEFHQKYYDDPALELAGLSSSRYCISPLQCRPLM